MKDKILVIGSVTLAAMSGILIARSCKTTTKLPTRHSTGEHAFRPSTEQRKAIAVAKRE